MASRLLTLRLVLAASLFLSSASAQVVASSGNGCGSPVTRGIQHNPLSLEFVDQRSMVLADGNRIDQETHEKFYRDSAGRTRTEHEMLLDSGERHLAVNINDAVKCMNILLDSVRKTAQVYEYPVQPPQASAPRRRPPVPSQNHSEEAPKEAPKVERLGHMTIEGLDAVGTRTTWTMQANAIGNAQPIVHVNETWVSPELGMPVLSKYSDPRSGESVRRLVSVQRNEPDPALFQIPPDYTVTQLSQIVRDPQP